MREHGFDESVRIGAGNGRFVREADAVAENFLGDGFDVFRNGVVATGDGGEGFGGADEADGGSRRRAVGDHFRVIVHAESGGVAGGGDEVGNVRIELVVDVDAVFYGITERDDLLLSKNLADFREARSRHAAHDFDFFGLARVVYANLEEETVERGLRKRVGSFFFERVHGGDHEERRRKRKGFARDGHLAFLHGFEKGRLDLRRRAVDFVGDDDVREDRPLLYGKFPGLGAVGFGPHDVGGKEVRRELHADGIEVEGFGEGFGDEGLGQSGDAFEKDVAIGKKAYEEAF